MSKTILHLIETLGHGGAEHQLALAVGALNREKYRSLVCHLYSPGHLKPTIEASGVKVLSLGLARSKKNWPEALFRLFQIVRCEGVDLIHTSLFEADLLGGVVGMMTGVPVMGTLCNIGGEAVRLEDNPRLGAFRLKASTMLWGLSLRRLHAHSIAISNAVQNSAIRTFGLSSDPSRSTVIYRAITQNGRTMAPSAMPGARENENLDQSPDQSHNANAHDPGVTARLRALLDLGESAPVILHVGRLAPQKGQRYLLEAMAAVLVKEPRARLLVVGEGWLRPALEAQAQSLGISKAVSFLGRREDVPALHRVADMFVFPSLFEGLGVSLLEAAHAGLACIASNVGPLPEIIEDQVSGILVPAKDADALSAAILRISSDDEMRRRLGENAQKSVSQRFDLRRMIDGMEKLYDSVFARRDVVTARAGVTVF
ncbi:MAG: glycosyltransferase [Deltaproteobacteria bacterium]|nr:glycosyltransferase [Deltaproteobacteria bacterium]